ncbi:MAG TPA: hypothetical protein VFI02_16455, partial [Armatimonadota bacterium]|nr:hypothetical protein [Armatimonadota bacterium]
MAIKRSSFCPSMARTEVGNGGEKVCSTAYVAPTVWWSRRANTRGLLVSSHPSDKALETRLMHSMVTGSLGSCPDTRKPTVLP